MTRTSLFSISSLVWSLVLFSSFVLLTQGPPVATDGAVRRMVADSACRGRACAWGRGRDARREREIVRVSFYIASPCVAAGSRRPGRPPARRQAARYWYSRSTTLSGCRPGT